MDPEYIFQIIKQALETVKMVQEDKFGSLELKVFQDDILLGKCRSLIYQTCGFVYEEYNLKGSPKLKESIERYSAMSSDVPYLLDMKLTKYSW